MAESRSDLAWYAVPRPFERNGVIGIEPDRLVIVGDSAVDIALGLVRGGTVVEGKGVVRIEPDRLVEFRDGTDGVALPLVRITTAVESINELWTEPDCRTGVCVGPI